MKTELWLTAKPILWTAFTALALAACGSDPTEDADGEAGAAGSKEAGGSGGSSSEAEATIPDRCAKCSASDQCSTGFCNRLASSDLATLIGTSQPQTGLCSAADDATTCNCQLGWISNGSVCVGTGCPSGDPIELCDNLSGVEYAPTASAGAGGGSASGGAGGTGASGGTAGAGGTTVMPSECSADPTDACEVCFAGSCCSQLMTCAGSQDCVSLLNCLSPCSTDSCVDSCVLAYPSGATPLINLLDCVNVSCSTQCS